MQAPAVSSFELCGLLLLQSRDSVCETLVHLTKLCGVQEQSNASRV